MGSAILYLAIVVMWLSVLLPMWLRRDRHNDDDAYEEQPAGVPVSGDASEEASDEASDEASEADTIVDGPAKDRSNEEPVGDGGTTAGDGPVAAGSGDAPASVDAPARPVRTKGRRRARVVARRRRRLLWSILLVLASVVTAAVRVAPWWAVAPSGVLLVGYLAVLRVAVRVDREQRDRAARARAEHLRRQRERRRAMAALKAREAEIIQFEARKRVQVFDQYADGRRAVGD
ncbi:hypothetical protein [Microbispora sp. NPDC049125]|uniref:divisome protein SepX/GlpR n=1 Tax=Microbispora sp. NPDC049125 TaxID=3154929 RepID=UPI003466BE82